MENKHLALFLLLSAISMFAVAAVLYYDYVKTATYVCYYGQDMFKPNNDYIGLGDSEHNYFSNGSWNSWDDIRCVQVVNSEDFVCPAKYSSQEFLGYDHYSRSTLKSYLTINNTSSPTMCKDVQEENTKSSVGESSFC